VVQISRQLMSHDFTRELHCLILLNLLVAFVYWVFFMDFNKLTLIIINLLPESYRILVGIDLFHVACLPATTPCNLEPVCQLLTGILVYHVDVQFPPLG